VQALGQPGDVFLGISTSGKSPNVLRALALARSRGVVTVCFTGSQGGPILELCDLLLAAPSTKTAIIQQIHITAAHTVCALVERAMFPMKVVNVHA
jgi:D-sedoheptulose 7-phosphate isomerase